MIRPTHCALRCAVMISVAATGLATAATTPVAGAQEISAHRHEHESFEQAKRRVTGALRTWQADGSAQETAYLADVVGIQRAASEVVEWHGGDLAALQRDVFNTSRDRFLPEPYDSSPDVLRRVSWRYPHDGSYWRTEAFNRNLVDGHLHPKLQTVHVFGKMAAKTPHAKRGLVRWWFHTTPVTRIGEQVWVLDAALGEDGPMRLEDWLERVVDGARSPIVERALLRIAVCSPGSIWPTSDCDHASGMPDSQHLAYADRYLKREWENELELGRDPEQTLLND